MRVSGWRAEIVASGRTPGADLLPLFHGCVPTNRSDVSGGEVVTTVQTTEPRHGDNLVTRLSVLRGCPACGHLFLQPKMCPVCSTNLKQER